MNYFVVDPSGTSYGPADINLLRQWAAEGRVQPTMTIRDGTGQTMLASSIPGLFPATYQGTPYQGTPYSQQGTPYSQNPQQGLHGQASGYYPRPNMMDDGSKDGTTALVLGILSLVCCGVVGLILGVVGVTYAKRAMAKGYRNANAALILSYVGIALGAIGTVLRIVGLVAFGF